MQRKDFTHLNLDNFPHKFPIQVRFVDIDKLGHVNNAVILSYFEAARVDFLSKMLPKNDWKKHGLILAQAEVNYFKPVYEEDRITVYTRLAETGKKSFKIENLLVAEDGLGGSLFCCHATGILVCMDYERKITIPIPENWKSKMPA